MVIVMKTNRRFVLMALIVTAAFGRFSFADHDDLKQRFRARVLREVSEILVDGDSFQAAQHIQRVGGGPLRTAKVFEAVMTDLYWNRRDLGGVVTIATAGIHFALDRAYLVRDEQPDLAEELRLAAKILAYNLGSYTWPGWNEPGIEIKATHLAIGMDAARANLRLVKGLDKGPLARSRAHWLLGAHQLASNHAEARASFEVAHEKARKAGVPKERLLASGYIAIVLMREGKHGEGKQLLAEVRQKLGNAKDGHGDPLIKQIDTARAVFVPDT